MVTPPADARFDSKNVLGRLIKVAKEITERKGCRTTVHVIDEAGRMLTLELLTDREVLRNLGGAADVQREGGCTDRIVDVGCAVRPTDNFEHNRHPKVLGFIPFLGFA